LLLTAQPSARYPQGGHHISTKRLNDDFKAAAKRAAVSGVTLHGLRHGFATTTINAGVPAFVVAAWLGHRTSASSSAQTSDYYHLDDCQSKRWMDSVSFCIETNVRAARTDQPESEDQQ
jgi:integrase